MKVYVQDKNGKPLDPTNPARARKLLNKDRAEVVERQPFTIKILDRKKEESYTRDTTLGIDAGYSKIGFSAVTKDEEIISGIVELRNDISKKLEQRRNYRRQRRHRNTRYREPRFDNREKKEGWLAPSIRHKKKAHIKLVNEIKELLPIDETIIEIAKFDQQKMENAEISGKEYQQGTLQGYNVRNYLLEKFDYECVYCGKSNIPLEVEHIVPKTRGGSDRVSNLTISCSECNQEKDKQTAEEFGYPEIQEKAKKSLKSTAFMNQVRWKMVNELGCKYTFGHITKKKRLEKGIEKSHINDAFLIAKGDEQRRSDELFVVKQKRRNDRSLQLNRSGHGRSVRKKRYTIQSGDLIEKNGEVKKSKGVFSYGRYVRIDGGEDDYWKTEEVNVVKYGKGMQFKSIHHPPKIKDLRKVSS